MRKGKMSRLAQKAIGSSRRIRETLCNRLINACMFVARQEKLRLAINGEAAMTFPFEQFSDKKIESAFKYADDTAEYSSDILWVSEAWVFMLFKTGIIKRDEAKKVFRCLLALEGPAGKSGKYKSSRALEKYVAERAGGDAGGNLGLARTNPTPFARMETRVLFLKALCTILQFEKDLLRLAGENTRTLMPGYTHLQHAQVTTFGHYLLSVFDPVFRTLKQAELAYSFLNLDELGAGALSGTSWPIDREMTAKMLGFDGIVENANDCVSGTDCYAAVCSSLASTMAVVSRFAVDLNYWSTLEFGMLNVPRAVDSESHSYMMPNKISNKRDLENARVASAKLTGLLTESLGMAQRVTHADMHEMLHMKDSAIEACNTVRNYLSPFLVFVPKITPDEERMRQLLSAGFSTATELSNILLREYGIPYRTGHHIVNRLAHIAREKGIGAAEMETGMLDEAARQITAREIEMPPEAFKKAVSPENFAESHGSRGGIAPAEVKRMIGTRKVSLQEAIDAHARRAKQVYDARKDTARKLKRAADSGET